MGKLRISWHQSWLGCSFHCSRRAASEKDAKLSAQPTGKKDKQYLGRCMFVCFYFSLQFALPVLLRKEKAKRAIVSSNLSPALQAIFNFRTKWEQGVFVELYGSN